MPQTCHPKLVFGSVVRTIARSITTWPDVRGWVRCLVVFMAYAAIALPLGLASDHLRFEVYSGEPGRLLRFTAIAFFVPCMCEELLFRAVLLPDPWQSAPVGYRIGRSIVALTLFVLWHPLNGLFLKTATRQSFLDPGFLMLAALLGGCCTVVYMWTKSIWPSTLVHWISVICWKVFLGGQIFD